MILTDTHTHLYSEAFDEDRDEVIRNAIKNGVERFFIPAIDSTYTESMFALQAAYPEHMFLMTGLHPTHVKEDFREELNHVEKLLSQRKFYAIGEIGIDLYWDKTFLKEQQEAFQYQIQLAKKHGLPIVIHCREAFDEVFDVLEREKGEGLFGIFHCFTGTLEQAEKAISYNLKLGIGGVVTFKNGKIDTFLQQVPIEHIVLETDAPYLAPVPYRGKRNESGYLVNVANKLSNIYNMDIEDLARITTQNSKEIFGI
ncbi:TatD family hydrolase [Maribacter sp. TH_r10]|uniref:TatD family hydrolase n=1 Tax=Maribacter sp. TH_r10 TaxID=3082086 RepID=UPI0029546F54|nr:TatD family hydrolase [Maribacter sp. TH_r10]MDV7139926.1 TatD family hydrolase [Maribacter sp. TH_r10]